MAPQNPAIVDDTKWLSSHISSDALRLPIDKREANSVDLSRALSRLAGDPNAPPPGSNSHVDNLVAAIGAHDHYVFVLADGFGRALLQTAPQGGFFRSAEAIPIRSVFPSTTAVALTSLASGAWPAEHALTGWWTHFADRGRVVAPLPFVERGSGNGPDTLGFGLDDVMCVSPAAGRFTRTFGHLVPKKVQGGAFSVWQAGDTAAAYQTLWGGRRVVQRFQRRAAGPSYLYWYVPDIDSNSHEHGVRSKHVARAIARLDKALLRLRRRLPASARIVVTADHGLIDIPAERQLLMYDDDPLMAHLQVGPTGEATTPVFHTKRGHEAAFLSAFAAHRAGGYFRLFRPQTLARFGLYGPDPLSRAAARNLGDFVGLAAETVTLEYVPPGGEPHHFVGWHGGLRPEEMEVNVYLA